MSVLTCVFLTSVLQHICVLWDNVMCAVWQWPYLTNLTEQRNRTMLCDWAVNGTGAHFTPSIWGLCFYTGTGFTLFMYELTSVNKDSVSWTLRPKVSTFYISLGLVCRTIFSMWKTVLWLKQHWKTLLYTINCVYTNVHVSIAKYINNE